MAPARAVSRPRGLLSAALGLCALAVVGFAGGFLLGGFWQSPGLVARHVLGGAQQVAWELEREADAGEPAPTAGPREEGPHVSAAPPPAPAAGVRMAVQVGAFAENGSAERLAEKLRQQGFPVYLSASAGADETRWRVRVGPFSSRQTAEQTATRLKAEQRLPTWVLDEDGPTG